MHIQNLRGILFSECCCGMANVKAMAKRPVLSGHRLYHSTKENEIPIT